VNILTFDIEEWFHILDNQSTKTEHEWNQYESRIHENIDRLLELLEKNNQKATFFCLGWIAKKYPEVIKRIDSFGHEIGTHSNMHQLVFEQSRKEFTDDLAQSIKSIEDIIGKKVRAYRAPGFSVKEENRWVFELMSEYGITLDCSIFPAKRTHGGFENFGEAQPSIIEFGDKKIKEFPINIYKTVGRDLVFSGGGYFRLLPYWMIKRMMRRSDYVMTYFHPRDFDANQPIIKELSSFRRFKSYVGISQALKKLERLLNDFEFVDLDTADKQIDWSSAKKIVLA